MVEGSSKPKARTGDGTEIHPCSGVVPILKEIVRGQLSVIGTGFFISRYGLFATAAHVVEALVSKNELGISFILHSPEKQEEVFHLRKIRRITFFNEVDLAIGQADNYVDKFANNPLSNLRCMLSVKIPRVGSRVYTYAYPENEILDFGGDNIPIIKGDLFEGEFLSLEKAGDNPIVPYDHYTTSIRVRSGASGGPVFAENGNVIGVNCRGWDFDGAEHQGDELSTIVPISYILEMGLDLLQLPEVSWEHKQLPEDKVKAPLLVKDLVSYGHVICK